MTKLVQGLLMASVWALVACSAGGGTSPGPDAGLPDAQPGTDVDVANPADVPTPPNDVPVGPPDQKPVDVGDVPPVAQPLGAACTNAGNCQSGFCSDGVCCDDGCTAVCRACNLAGHEGTCTFIEADVDPAAECPPCSVCNGSGNCVAVRQGGDPKEDCAADDVATCGLDGECDGVGGCRFYADGTECQAGVSCQDDALVRQRCRLGACAPETEPCAPYGCGSDEACALACDPLTGAGCAVGNFECDENGACVGILPDGSPCTLAGECRSGSCVDGVCCESACDGPCQACNLEDSEGSCLALPEGSNPDDECGTGVCGGTCDGAGACAYAAAGLACGGEPPCGGSCDGAGQCAFAGSDTLCGTCLRCNGTGACDPVPAGDDPFDQCPAGESGCDASCDGNGRCAYPADDTCGLCRRCSATGACVPATAGLDPYDQCNEQPVTSCGQDGTCDGAGACRVYDEGTECGATACAGAALTTRACSAGACRTTTGDCGGYLCASASACADSCGGDDDCADGYTCQSGQCTGQLPDGATCLNGEQCDSGRCVDNVCCASDCAGLCESCALPGNLGRCTPIADGSDPADECAGDGPCDGSCDGAGACRFPDSAVSCGGCMQCDGQGGCVPVAEGLDPNDDCAGDDALCGGTCDGSGGCQFPSGELACGDCMQCSGAGTCGPVVTGQDPFADCAGSGACDGTCDGGGGCQFPGTTTRCATCQVCDGNGNCSAVPSGSDPFDDCAGRDATCGGVCNGSGACATPPGTTTPCGTCKRCDGLGACTNVPANTDPFNQCPGTDATCGAACTAQGTCAATPAQGLVCGTCQQCDGQGTCGGIVGSDPHDSCNDNLACTDDVCQGANNCQYPLQANRCLIGGVCYSANDNNPNNECQSCQPTVSTSAWSPKANNSACTADLLGCTRDVCQSGQCTHPHDPASNQCLIAGACYANQAPNPTNDCQYCNVGTGDVPLAWSNRASGTACASDGEPCTQDACNGSGACTHAALEDWSSCDDGLATTLGDWCNGGRCSGFNRALLATANPADPDQYYAADTNAASGGVHALYGKVICSGMICLPSQRADRFDGSTTPVDSDDVVSLFSAAASTYYIVGDGALRLYNGTTWTNDGTLQSAWNEMTSYPFSTVSDRYSGAIFRSWHMLGSAFDNTEHALVVRGCSEVPPSPIRCAHIPVDPRLADNWYRCADWAGVPGGTMVGTVSFLACGSHTYDASYTYNEYPGTLNIVGYDADAEQYGSRASFSLGGSANTSKTVEAFVAAGSYFVTVGHGNTLVVTPYTVSSDTFGTSVQVAVNGFTYQDLAHFEDATVWQGRVWVLGHYLRGSIGNETKTFVLAHAATNSALTNGANWQMDVVTSFRWPCIHPCASGSDLSMLAAAGSGSSLYLFGGWYNTSTDQQDRAVWMYTLPSASDLPTL